MKEVAWAVVAAGTLLAAAHTLAEELPGEPAPAFPLHYTLRASGGAAFASNGYFCGYYDTYYLVSYSCGAAYAAIWPNVNVDVDFWFRPTLGMTLGANVMWGAYTPSITGVPPNPIYSTTWEPHADFLGAMSCNPQWKWRGRIGLGLYLASSNGLNTTGNTLGYRQVGSAVRLGIGTSFLPYATVGIGIDAIFEAGWIANSYVSTVQLLVGPELHF